MLGNPHEESATPLTRRARHRLYTYRYALKRLIVVNKRYFDRYVAIALSILLIVGGAVICCSFSLITKCVT